MMKKTLIAVITGMSMMFTGAGTVMAEQPQEVSDEVNENERPEFGGEENGGTGGERMGKDGFGERGKGGPGGNGGNGAGGFGGMTDKSDDTELQEMISEVKDQFTTGAYTDEESGLTVPYDLYLPQDYDESRNYPMVVFIGDATTVGTDLEYSLTQGWGGIVWATEEEQEKQEAIVLVPVFPETVIDDNNGASKSDYLLLIPRMIEAVSQEYAVDTDRIYGTGQSMGAMATLYTAANYPELYAAVLIVDGQWDTSELSGLETQNMVYIAAGGDQKASQGQADVKAMLDNLGVSYAQAEGWDAQAEAEDLAGLCEELFSEGESINFITWEAGTVLNGSNGSEHMASFDYAYKLSAVRDWLFEQSR
ncbi:MAG: prolyl oligopeptidase family serine peptidase [Blautia sp.]|nr:prolyl oligopeptidase family serine peptidase [Blautia sp.]